MPATLILGAIFGDTLMAAAALGSVGYAAASFAISLVAGYAVSSLLQKPTNNNNSNISPQGTEIQLGPATDNKLPVLYGRRYAKGIVTDAIISKDQQTMWYVVAFSEATGNNITFGNVYYDSKLLIFDPANVNKITGWYTQPKKHSKTGGQYNTKPAGKLEMYFYKNGSANSTSYYAYDMIDQGSGNFDVGTQHVVSTTIDARTLLEDSSIPDDTKWTRANTMKNCVFLVVKLNYDSASGIYGLGQIDAEIINPLASPGQVIEDYLTNTVYGCGVPVANVNTASLRFIDTISDQPLSIVDTQGTTVTNTTTYAINGVLDTAQDCLTNLNNLSDACDSWIQWNEKLGQWGVIPNVSLEQAGGSTTTMTVITSDHIIGGINLTPTDLKTSANKIAISFPNSDIINQVDYRYYSLKDDRPELISPNEPDNIVNINMPFVSDSIQATYLGYRKLFMSREDILINFSMDYSGIGINAGDIVAIQHEWYGWEPGVYNQGYYPGKPFRVTQIREAKDGNGFLGVQISAMAYNDSIYTTMNPHYYTPDTFGMAIDAANVTPPGRPDTPASSDGNATPAYPNAAVPYFTISSALPVAGLITNFELWAGLTNSTPFDSTWILVSTAFGQGNLLPNSTVDTASYVNFDVNSLPPGSYYFSTRAYGVNGYSSFSPISTPVYSWSPSAAAGSATNATDSTNAAHVAMNSGSGEYYLTHTTNTSGNQPQYANSNLKYNATSHTLMAQNASLSSAMNLTPLTAPPAGFVAGTVAMADNSSWNPVSPQTNTGTAYLAYYNGDSWIKIG